MNKRLISGLLSAVMAINVITILPADAFALGTESKVYEKGGYTVTYQIGSEWNGNRSVEVSIKNTGEESILNWALKYDVGGEVYNLWNSKVYDSSEEYTIIKNNGYNYEIEPGQSANYGYIVKGEETVIPEDIELCSRRIDVKSGYEIDFNVTSDWYTGFNGEISITNVSDEPIEAWTLSFDSNFDINNIWNAKLLTSENRSYEAANQLWTTPIKAGESASFGFSAEKSATENANAENFVLTAVVVGRSALEYPDFDDIDYELDSDSDGLPDYYEDILGTDKNNPDTDGDGLTDGYEVFYLGTDPLKADSDDNGVNDGDEDPDNDGLSNLKECELGTDPNNSDTDGDGLTDGAEVNIHKTDPLKYDTDEDGISDGDEIVLGLDPNSGSTNGTPDSERTFTQTVSADSEALSAINEDEDTPFKVSLEMKAAGVAEKNLSAYESGYSAVMQNDAVIGIIPQFNYGSGLSVEEVTVKFELNESIVNNTLGTYAENGNEFEGIKRLNIFKYFEDINMLLPVETFHDTDKNVVYTTTDCLGTYCLMDMEVWLDSLGISSTFGKTEVEESGAMSENSVDNDNYMCYTVNELEAKSNDSKYKDNLNVVFVIDTRIASDKLEETKEKILDISRTVLKHSPDSRIYIFEQNTDMSTDKGYKVYSAKGNRFFTDYNTLAETLKEVASSGSTEDSAILSDAVGGIISVCDLSRETYAFSLFSQEGVIYRTENGYDFLDSAVGKNVDISVIAKIDDSLVYGYAHDMHKNSGGIILSDATDYTEEVLKHIYGKKINKEEENTGKYKMILATGLRTVELKAPITEEYVQLAKLDEIDETQPDTDEDGLPDYKEINFSVKGADGKPLIEFVNGVVDLPTYGECVDIKSELTYVERGFNRFDDVLITDSNFINYVKNTVRVLPIISDPTSPDGDWDGLEDIFDPVLLSDNNNGQVAIWFTSERWSNLERYNSVTELYNDPTLSHGENSVEFYYKEYDVNPDHALDTIDNIVLLQKCLEYLKLLDMHEYNSNGELIKVPYGTFGGKTISAVQLFQINYGFKPINNNTKDVDYNTLQTIINVAINNGFDLSDSNSTAEEKYIRFNKLDSDDNNYKKYYSYIPTVVPKLSIEQAKEGIRIYKDVSTDYYDVLYYYDYTVPLDKLIDELSLETTLWHLFSGPEYANLIAFYLKVNHGEDWDVKVQSSWEKTIPNIKYYSQKFNFAFNDLIFTSEDLGNFIYGCTGCGCGFSLELLLLGSDFASHTGNSIESNDDLQFIKAGYDYYDIVRIRNGWGEIN